MRSILMTCVLLLSAGDGFAGAQWWDGWIELRGDRLGIRVALDPAPEPSAELDIPQLVMAWEPMKATRVATGIELEFPFGIGSFIIDSSTSGVRVDRLLGDETMTLELKRVPPPAFERKEVTFNHGEITLSGTLVRPDSAGSHPAIVLVHGSGVVTRSHWGYRSWADFFVRQGMTVLLFDQRGHGDSSGTWQEATFADLAGDVLAGVEFLRGQQGIDPGLIVLKGSSQGGWVAPLAVTLSGEPLFLILTSAPAFTPAEQEMQHLAEQMRSDGRPPHEINDALAYLRLYFSVAHTGTPWKALKRAAREASSSEWGAYVDQPRSLDDLNWWKKNQDFSPAEILGQVDGPVLALYGEKDVVVPPAPNAPLLEHLLRSGGNDDIILRTFPGADHRLEVPPGKDGEGRWHWFRIAPGVLAEIREWLETRVLSASASHSRSGG